MPDHVLADAGLTDPKPRIRAARAAFHELVVRLIFDKKTWTRATALALIEEQREVRAFVSRPTYGLFAGSAAVS